MTINLANNNPRIEYTVAQGVVQTVFTVPFEYFEDADVSIYVDGVKKSLGADYTLSGGDGSTGVLTFVTAVAPAVQQITGAVGGSEVSIVRDVALERTTDFAASGYINRVALNTQLDTIVAQVADLDDRVSRSLHLNDSVVGPDMLLTDARKGKIISFNETTGAVETNQTIADFEIAVTAITVATAQAVISTNEAAASAASAAAALVSETNAGTSETNSASSATSAAAQVTLATTAKTAAELAETNAETAETNAATSATNAATSATTASTGASTASTKATEAATSATSASTSATAASSSETAAATSESNASTSETNAATSATSAATSATASATSATAAAASEAGVDADRVAAQAAASTATTKASEASTSETNAATSASTATTKASEAATSATNSATSATESETAKTAAEAAKDAALAALDNFDDRYLGAKASDPTLDNDGNALVAGALYYNTTDDVMKVYEGTVWVAAYASLSGALLTTNNLSDVASVSSSRTNLGLGTADSPTFAGLTTTANVSFGDNGKAIFGASSDLKIFHDGNNSVIDEVGTGSLFIRGTTVNIQHIDSNPNEQMINAIANGAVTLSHNGSPKIATASTGVSVTGNIAATGTVTAGDSLAVDNTTGSPDQILLLLQADMGVSDRNMQIKSPSTDSVTEPFRFTTGNSFAFEIDATTDALVIDASANVGIGTATPDTLMELVGANPVLTIRDTDTGTATNDARLRLAESGAGSSLDNYFDVGYVADKFTIGSNTVADALTIDRITGYVGINNSSAEDLLDISRLGGNWTGPTTGTTSVALFHSGTTSTGSGAAITLGGGTAAPCEIYFADLDDADVGKIRYDHADNSMAFHTNNSERMVIDSVGNLTATGTVTAGDVNITGPSPVLKLTDNDDANEFTNIQNQSGNTYIDSRNGTANGLIAFRGRGNNVLDEYARFSASGNFGIGTQSPSAALDVVGDAEINGTLSVSSATPVINLLETDTSNQHRIIATGGSFYIQAQDSDGTNDGDLHLTGYLNDDLNLLNIKAVTTAMNGNLTVTGTVVSQDEVRAEVIAYTINQDAPYMVAATTSYTGATTNWGTYGYQHRLKATAAGVSRITVDTFNGEVYSLDKDGNAVFAGSVTSDTGLLAGAGAAAGAVGTYAFLTRNTAYVVFGSTYGGGGLRPAGLSSTSIISTTNAFYHDDESSDLYVGPGTDTATTPGTWRCMGQVTTVTGMDRGVTLFLRIA